ncbi:hypothetical protein DBR40_19990 [Pedobacter sp. KBW01]|nr:hypothetical protein DBR40_19990 [Pedobacter sp. KBW01]
MSLSHQRRQGDGTVDGQTLDWAKKSDLYKLAKEHYPNSILFPVMDSWEIGINENAENDLSLGALYFGKWIVNHNSQDVGDSDNSRKRSEAFLKHFDKVVSRTMIIVHGDDILSWKTATTKHLGVATSLHVRKLEEDDQPQHGVQVSFIGYKVTEDPNFNYPANGSPNIDGNIHLTAQDLTNAGYTYQWSATTGSGTFVNPNSPNTVFVPHGNGNYVLQLVVTTPEGVVSAPTVIPVTVDFDQSITINNLIGEPIPANAPMWPPFLPTGLTVRKGKNGSLASQYLEVRTFKPNAKVKLSRSENGVHYNLVYHSDILLNQPFFAEPEKDIIYKWEEEIIDEGINLNCVVKSDIIYNAIPATLYGAGDICPVYFPRSIKVSNFNNGNDIQLRDVNLGILATSHTGVQYQEINMVLPDGVTELFIENYVP